MRASSSETRRAAVAAALRENPAGVSGEALASRLGVSRVSISKHVAALRAAGYEVEASPASGYRLTAAPDAALPYEVAPLLRSHMWGRLEWVESTSSTNDDARALAQAGEGHGAVVLAGEQTAGRGRLGRAWSSPCGGVYMSVLLRPSLSASEAGPLPLVVGLGVAIGLESLGAEVGLKWPNDVLAVAHGAKPGGKVSGVLLESMVEGGRLAWVVAGVGVNVRRASRAVDGVAHLDDLIGDRAPLARVAAAVLDGIARTSTIFAESGFRTLRSEYEARSVLPGREVRVSDPSGAEIASGMVSGVDGSGRLLVRTPAGSIAVASGDVTLRPR